MSLDYYTLDLRMRQYDTEEPLFVEAFGPNGEWAESTTSIDPIKVLELEYDITGLGDFLGNALMPDRILQLYTAVLQDTVTRSNRGLRLKLHFTGVASKYAQLAWEAIRVNGRSISMDPRQAIVRTTDTLKPATSLAVEKPPYRVLVISSSPENVGDYHLEPLDLAKYAMQIREALAPLIENNLLQIEFHHNVSVGQVESFLKTGEFHILHFTGHGVTPHGGGQMALFFAKNDGMEVEIVRADRFGDMLLGTGVRMAFINSGATAYGPEGGVAEVLMQVGLPIVVAYNRNISIKGSDAFVPAFYNTLAHENSLEKAMLAGRLALAEATGDRNEWFFPVLFTRTLEGTFWTGEAGYRIETYMHDGRLVTEARQQGAFNPQAFANRLQTALENLENVTDGNDRAKAQEFVAAAQDAIANANADEASQKLSEAFTTIHLALTEQARKNQAERVEEEKLGVEAEKKAKKKWADSRARWTVLGMSVGLLILVTLLAFALRDIWTPYMMIPVIGIPVSVVVWSFMGGVAAMLQAFVGTKQGDEARQVNYEWLLWRPIVGMVMGTVVYLALAAGFVVLGQTDLSNLTLKQPPYLLWALAFLGGFSDRFAVLVFDNVVRTFSKTKDGDTPNEPQMTSDASSNSEPESK